LTVRRTSELEFRCLERHRVEEIDAEMRKILPVAYFLGKREA